MGLQHKEIQAAPSSPRVEGMKLQSNPTSSVPARDPEHEQAEIRIIIKFVSGNPFGVSMMALAGILLRVKPM